MKDLACERAQGEVAGEVDLEHSHRGPWRQTQSQGPNEEREVRLLLIWEPWMGGGIDSHTVPRGCIGFEIILQNSRIFCDSLTCHYASRPQLLFLVHQMKLKKKQT